MHLYSGKIRLGGSVLNEVRKDDLTAPEIYVLREIHGNDAVVDIKQTGVDKRSSVEERARLTTLYASVEDNNPEKLKGKIAMMRNLFGHDSMGLPDKLTEDVSAEPVVEKPKRTVVQASAALA